MSKSSWEELLQIMQILRSRSGCPWDKEQTHKSLAPFLIEEAYEALETIEEEDYKKLKEELGDLLLQVIFHAQIAKEKKIFNIEDIVQGLIKKLKNRHPHVFKNKKVATKEEVLEGWEKIKLKEGERKRKSLMDGIPINLPALLAAERAQNRAKEVGFDWREAEEVILKVKEESQELLDAYKKDLNQIKIKEEFGDLLFSLVNLSRFFKINAEESLRYTIKKFIKRFKYIEKMGQKRGHSLKKMSLNEMEKYYNKAKTR
ncbi:MAG: nucleoside triphosphate pyrophosphohydrolase [Armatimonadetes bacterium]|nr:nucleoside triphosphate pyrophosphohydrolase [Armatimonadota bacterium]